MAAYSAFPVHAAPGAEPKPATAATQAYLEQFSASLPFDREDFELATRGFVAPIPGNRILDAEGHLIRDLNVDGFFSQPAPPTVNPSLWRNTGLPHLAFGFFDEDELPIIIIIQQPSLYQTPNPGNLPQRESTFSHNGRTAGTECRS